MSDNEFSLGVNCPGCDVELTVHNAGGYQCFCEKCVEAFPVFPATNKPCYIDGKYPDFKWVEDK